MTQPLDGDGFPLASEPPPPLPPAAPIIELNDAPAAPAAAAPAAPPPPEATQLPRSLLPPDQLPYPVRYEVAYPERLSRWKTFIRLPLLLPVYLFLYLVLGALYSLFVIGWTGVFWRKKYPTWAFAGSSGAMAYFARATAYGLLQTDKFPSFSYERPDVVLEFAEPPSGQLSRWRVFWWKLVLLVPHFAAFYFLQAALSVVTMLAWFGILFTGNYPRGMFAFATGMMRWQYRVLSYFVSYNDRYPPFALSRDAGPAGRATVVWSGLGGLALTGGFMSLVIAAAAVGTDGDHQTVRYADLRSGRGGVPLVYRLNTGPVTVTLKQVTDPGDSLAPVLKPGPDEKLVVFQWTVRNASGAGRRIGGAGAASLRYRDSGAHSVDAEFITVDNRVAPAEVNPGTVAVVQAVFVVPRNAVPNELRFETGWTARGGILYTLVQ